MGLNARQIDQFVCVVEQGGLTKAAKVLDISQPALTKSMRQLERDLKVRLLERHAAGVRTTVFGQCLYEHAKRVEWEFDRARKEIEALRGAHTGSVAVGAIPIVTKTYLPAAVIRLMKARPDVSISVAERHNSELLPAFRRGQFDFIVAIVDPINLEDGLHHSILFYDELVLTLREDHPLLHTVNLTPRELTKYRWIYPSAGSAHRRRIDDYFRSLNALPPSPTIEGASEAFIKAVLLKSDLVAALPKGLVHDEGYADGLAEVSLQSAILRRPIGIIHRGLATLSPLSRLLLSEIQNACTETLAPMGRLRPRGNSSA